MLIFLIWRYIAFTAVVKSFKAAYLSAGRSAFFTAFCAVRTASTSVKSVSLYFSAIVTRFDASETIIET